MLDATFSALSDPTRRGILSMLAEKECSVGEIVDRFSVTQSAISRHLQVLEHANLVTRRRDGQRRMCALKTDPLAEIDAWMAFYRRFWSDRLDRLEATLTPNEDRP